MDIFWFHSLFYHHTVMYDLRLFLTIIFKAIKISFHLEFYIITLVFTLNGKLLNVSRNWSARVDGVVSLGIAHHDSVLLDGRLCVHKTCPWAFHWDCGLKKTKSDTLKNIIDMSVLQLNLMFGEKKHSV